MCAQKRARERKLRAQQARRKKNNRPSEAKLCLGCGISFLPFHRRDKFHSKACRLAYRKPRMQKYAREYYRQHPRLKDRTQERWQANRARVPTEELERLRLPQNRSESQCYGSEGKIVCLACGWIGDDLNHHVRHCRVKQQGSSAYRECWGFDASTSLVSPKQRDAYSEIRRRSVTFEGRQQNALKHRGNRTGPRLQQRKVSDSKIREVFRLGLSVTEAAKRAGMSRGGYYKCAYRLGLDIGAPRRQQLEFGRFASDLGKWIELQSQTPAREQIMQHYEDELRLPRGRLTRSPELSSFLTHLEPMLGDHPEWIAEIAISPQARFRLASRVFQRARAGVRTRGAGGRPLLAKKETQIFQVGQTVEGAVPDFDKIFAFVRSLPKRERAEHSKLRSALKKEGYATEKIEATLRADRPLTAARWLVSLETRLSYDVVKKYHVLFRKSLLPPQT